MERSHVVLKLILNSDLGQSLFRQKHTDPYRSTSHKNLQKKWRFLYRLLYAWLYLTNNNFPAFISIISILDQPIFLNAHTRMDFKHPTQEYFKFTIIRDLCRFLQQGLTSFTIFTKILLGFPTANQTRYLNLLWPQFPMIGNTKN